MVLTLALNIGFVPQAASAEGLDLAVVKQIDNTLQVKPQPVFPDRSKEVKEANEQARLRAAEAEAQRVAEEARVAAEQAAVAAEAERQRVAAASITYYSAPRYGVGGPNAYSYGQCTYYVKNRRPDIGSYWGNANQWLYNAQAAGYATGSAPRAGAIAWTGRGSAGHVAYVESVNGNGTINISEMNAPSWNQVTYRTAGAGEFYYIY